MENCISSLQFSPVVNGSKCMKYLKKNYKLNTLDEEKGFQDKVGTPKGSKGKNQMVLIKS